MIYLDLFLGFLKVGCFAFGGAYGAIPLIRDVVLSHGWLTDEGLSYLIAVSESSPGPIMVNLATFVGNTQAGVLGALVATAAVVLPAFLIILFIAASLNAFLKSPYFQAVLRGLKPCIIGLILATGLFMLLQNCLGLSAGGKPEGKAILLALVLGALMFGSEPVRKKKMNPILLILIAGVLGILVYGL